MVIYKDRIPKPDLRAQQVWELIISVLQNDVLKNMQGFNRGTFGKQMMRKAWEILDTIIEVAFLPNGAERIPYLHKADIGAKTLLRMIAIAGNCNILPKSVYYRHAEKFTEVGRCIGGLLSKARAEVRAEEKAEAMMPPKV